MPTRPCVTFDESEIQTDRSELKYSIHAVLSVAGGVCWSNLSTDQVDQQAKAISIFTQPPRLYNMYNNERTKMSKLKNRHALFDRLCRPEKAYTFTPPPTVVVGFK
ncbi:Ig mu chain C region [Trichinella pseudospiralis]|uniref:Uncharacterized protein n=2 Tax=Trichinella pseudospiralis TaxID=6337 RepID=A0A0V1G2N9_TRIPS|nr:hypothetical protein T4D_11352 [Trichinella pseudospiralis]